MKLLLALIVILAGFVPAKLKMESACQQSQPAALSLDLREKIGQSAFVAVLGGVADRGRRLSTRQRDKARHDPAGAGHDA